MKKTFPFRTLLLTMMVLALGATSGAASEVFRILRVSVTDASDAIYVDQIARKDLPKRLRVSLRASKEIPAAKVQVKAYFYDKDKNLIKAYKRPNDVWRQGDKGMGWYGAPETYTTRQEDVFFAITDELKDRKWKSVIVLFGEGKDMVARSIPKGAVNDHEYPEAKLVRKK